MTAISSWKGMAEMPKFKSSAPRGYGLWMSHYFLGGGGGGTTYFICGKTSSSRVPESDGLFICFGGIINV